MGRGGICLATPYNDTTTTVFLLRILGRCMVIVTRIALPLPLLSLYPFTGQPSTPYEHMHISSRYLQIRIHDTLLRAFRQQFASFPLRPESRFQLRYCASLPVHMYILRYRATCQAALSSGDKVLQAQRGRSTTRLMPLMYGVQYVGTQYWRTETEMYCVLHSHTPAVARACCRGSGYISHTLYIQSTEYIDIVVPILPHEQIRNRGREPEFREAYPYANFLLPLPNDPEEPFYVCTVSP